MRNGHSQVDELLLVELDVDAFVDVARSLN